MVSATSKCWNLFCRSLNCSVIRLYSSVRSWFSCLYRRSSRAYLRPHVGWGTPLEGHAQGGRKACSEGGDRADDCKEWERDGAHLALSEESTSAIRVSFFFCCLIVFVFSESRSTSTR